MIVRSCVRLFVCCMFVLVSLIVWLCIVMAMRCRMFVQAEISLVGNEILQGKIKDSNGSFFAKELSNLLGLCALFCKLLSFRI